MARVGAGGRLLRTNTVPVFLSFPSSVISLGTADNDCLTTLIMPSYGYVGHSTLGCSSGGTGTSLCTVVWYDAASAGGNKLSEPHVDNSGALVALATSGLKYAAEGARQDNDLDEGAQLFLNVHFEAGTHTAGGSWQVALQLIL